MRGSFDCPNVRKALRRAGGRPAVELRWGEMSKREEAKSRFNAALEEGVRLIAEIGDITRFPGRDPNRFTWSTGLEWRPVRRH